MPLLSCLEWLPEKKSPARPPPKNHQFHQSAPRGANDAPSVRKRARARLARFPFTSEVVKTGICGHQNQATRHD